MKNNKNKNNNKSFNTLLLIRLVAKQLEINSQIIVINPNV